MKNDAMALTTTLVGQVPPGLYGAKHAASVATSPEEPDKINSITDFIRYQARNIPDTPLIAYPSSEHGASDFVDYTAKELDAFADEAAKWLVAQGLKPTVGLSCPSDFNTEMLTGTSMQRVARLRS